MTRILTSDILIADVIAPVQGHAALGALVEAYHLRPGGKAQLNEEQATAFAEAFAQVDYEVVPGGSSANMLTTLSKLMPHKVDVRFVGIAGEGEHSKIIREAMAQAHVALVPEHMPVGVQARAAMSYVLVFPEGQCTIATVAGNARELLKPAVFAEHVVKNADVLLAQGSLWHKFHEEFADRLYALCMKHGRQFWLTLPTQAKPTAGECAKIIEMLPDATLVLGNEAEMLRLFPGALPDAAKKLQRLLQMEGRPPVKPERNDKIAFITLGERGCVLITQDKIEQIAAPYIAAGDIVNTIGAGDTAYAGFAAGYLKGLPAREAAQLGMALAGEKLRINAPRLPDPKATLEAKIPPLAALLAE